MRAPGEPPYGGDTLTSPLPQAGEEHKFAIGDRVRVLESNPAGNPRTPLHIRGKTGVVAALRGTMENPLDHRGVYPPLCTVEFAVADVFGGGSTDKLLLDLHEDWLEPSP